MASSKLILDYVYEHETNRASQIYLTQPTGGGNVVDYTWAQLMDQSRRMATYLKAQGFEPGARIAILSKNTAHFIMAELAIWMAGYTTVAIFPTEGADTVNYVLTHSEAKMLFVGKLDTWDNQIGGIPANLPCIALPLSPKTSYRTWDDITKQTQPIAGKPARDGKDIMFIMYTSGSTGTPKGVMHSFERGTAASVGFDAYTNREIGANSPYRVLSYLPLAHIFERACVECAGFIGGRGRIFFAESLDTFVQDLQRAQPTVFISVPRLWLKFQQGVLAKMPQKKLDKLLGIPILGGIVKKKVLTKLGLQNALLAGSGSAPIPPALLEWYRKLGLNLVEGLGMTEDFAFSHTTRKGSAKPGYVGFAHEGVERRFSESGELLIKSPGTFVGYYKQPELTAESFTADGFFMTGDKGELSADGQLKLTGRAKELFKTAKGKYVAPAPIENMINESPMVELSMVSGIGQPAAYALVVPSEALRPQLKDPAVRAEFEAEMKAVLARVNAKVADYEQLAKIVVAREPWSIENGQLTPTMKIKRAKIEGGVAANVDKWYESKGQVIWA
ncbi:AMP-binding protein [Variovorax sp. PCZ-1]|uniref:AMP-binding protein n=1 Tax=Variovorax sp. PCZ-1 TaxID=2835533 RepID=UPI001BCECC1C|nr:AMP-binding protein [Variovorax sp. PCZ-1]MBS7808924.1 AMP-binding protein [Variovorax sp. PCZ-1]